MKQNFHKLTQNNYTIGIGGILGHDANVALFKNDQLIASSQEERFTKIKHDATFPINAINDCLDTAKISYEQINACVFSEKPFYVDMFDVTKKQPSTFTKLIGKFSGLFKQTIFEKQAKALFQNAVFHYSWHHASHALAAFHSSDFKESVFLCIDGKSENSNASIGYINETQYEFSEELLYENGLGMFYTYVTHFLGFPSFGSEYKVMGLAPYGKPNFTEELYSLSDTDENGNFKIKFNPSFHPLVTPSYFHYIEKVTDLKPVQKGENLTEKHIDLASSLQKLFETEVVKMAKYAKKLYPKSRNLVFCGGCAQNCVTAGVLRDANIFENVFNSPIGGDMGSAMGACIDYMRSNGLPTPNFFKKNFYFGSSPGNLLNDEAIKNSIPVNDIYKDVAKLLAEGKIVGWVRGGMELGARALGARSILANPSDPEMQSKMNKKIKFRESFRPFAPIILEEEQEKWFDTGKPSYYMQYTAFLKNELRFKTPDSFTSFKEQLNFPRCSVPSIVHVDFSARLQTISKDVHQELYQLLQEFKSVTGIPLLINTSFNVNGQPIVRTALDAWECFIHTDIDYLVVEDQLFKNPQKLTTEDKIKWLSQFSDYSR